MIAQLGQKPQDIFDQSILVKVPAGTAVGFSCWTYEASTLEGDGPDDASLRRVARLLANIAKKKYARADGNDVPNIEENNIETTLFGLFIPSGVLYSPYKYYYENKTTLVPLAKSYLTGSVTKAVAAGNFFLLNLPPRTEEYDIEFGGESDDNYTDSKFRLAVV